MLKTIDDNKLIAIGDAIRERNGTTDKYTTDEMPQAILSIVSDKFNNKAFVEGSLESLEIEYGASDKGVLLCRPHAFDNLEYLKSLTIGEGITSIECWYGDNSSDFDAPFSFVGYTVGGCDITFPSTLKSIGAYAFYQTRFGENTLNNLPNGLEYIGAFAFSSGGAVSEYYVNDIIIPASVKKIGASAFRRLNWDNIYFKGTPEAIEGTETFWHVDSSSKNIYVPWSEGEISTTNWSLPANTTIHYNYTE